ncbi:hypothetical protein [Kosakonia sacchari]|uniref:hypothetical protein n=1 Tax=Kosakonia sacchari TaxID=1158459 RepID=UPI000BE5E464|nr:hypothetical protein [Kosakonia sacchari]PDO82723.1 hypothetical protein BK797_18785 [Kosakonia sacchari]
MLDKTLKILTIILVSLIIIVFVNIIHFQLKGTNMEIGSWSDWVSAVCNIIMAAAAFYAAYNAKKWFSRKTSENSHSLAINLKVDIEKALKIAQADYLNIANRINSFRSNPSRNKCDNAYDYREEVLSKMNDINEFHAALIRIESHDINIMNKKILSDSIEMCSNLYAAASSIFQYQYELLSGDTSISPELYDEIVDELLPLKNKITKQYETLLNCRFDAIFKSIT